MVDLKEIEAQAKQELADEERKLLVAAAKVRLRAKRPLWYKLFPWTITIRRR